MFSTISQFNNNLDQQDEPGSTVQKVNDKFFQRNNKAVLNLSYPILVRPFIPWLCIWVPPKF